MIKDVLQRIETRLDAVGLSAARASQLAGLSKDAIRNMQRAAASDSRQGVSTNTLAALAAVLETSPSWLLTGESSDRTATQTRIVRVLGHVQAGAWAETWELPLDEQYEVPVPADPALAGYQLYAAETRGPSMNKRYPEGTVLVFTDAIETGEDIQVGKRYIVERQRADGLREATVKALWRDDAGKIWLIPESDDPRFQAPIDIEAREDDTVRIIGRVRYAVSRE